MKADHSMSMVSIKFSFNPSKKKTRGKPNSPVLSLFPSYYFVFLPVLIHELLVKLGNAANPLRARSQESGTEMQSAFLLAESVTRNDADAGGFEESHAVKLIGGAAFSSRSLRSLSSFPSPLDP